MAKPPKKRYGSWLRNFGTSTKFAAIQVLNDITPHSSGAVKSMGEDIRELRQDLRRLKSDKRAIINYLLGEDEQMSEYVNIALKNAKSSLKTGKFIDSAREDRLMMKAMGMEDMDGFGDFGDDSGSDDFNFDDDTNFDDDFGSVQMGPSKIVNMMGPSNKAIGAVNETISNQTNTVAQGFSALDKSNKQTFAISLAMNERFHSAATEHLTGINESLKAVVSFNNESMSPFVQGSLKYYDDSLTVLKDIHQSLVDMRPKAKDGQLKDFDDGGYGDIFSNGFSIKGYAQRVARNARSSFQNSPFGMLEMFNNPMMLAGFAANPLGMALSMGMQAALPAGLEKAFKRTDASAKEFMPALFRKIASYESSDNPLISTLAEIFGIRQGKGYDKYKTGDWERGAISYDGESKKALTEVIPNYLSKIVYTLDAMAHHQGVDGFGPPKQIVYDWSNNSETGGKFTTIDVLSNRERRDRRKAKLSGFYESQSDFSDAVRAMYGWGDKSNDLRAKFDDMLENMVDSDRAYKPGDIEHLRKYFGKDAEVISSVIQSMSNAALMQMAGSGILSGRTELAKYYHGNGMSQITSNMNTTRSGIFNPIVSDFGTRYYRDDKNLGITWNADKSEWEMDKSNILDYNKKHKTRFGNVEQVMKHFDSENPMNSFGGSKDFFEEIDSGLDGTLRSEYERYAKANGANALTFEEFAAQNRESIRGRLIQERLRKVREENSDISDNSVSGAIGKFFNTPVKFVEGALNKIDQTMYKIIFGTDNDQSIFSQALAGIRKTFDQTMNFFRDDVITPFKKSIFGDNIKDSEWYKAAKEALNVRIFGEKDKDGKWGGGVLSGTINAGNEFFANTKEEYEKWFKPKVEEMGNIIRQYFFGPDKEPTDPNAKKEPFVDRMMATINRGFSEWSAMMFGRDHENEDDVKKSGAEAAAAFKKAIPKGYQGAIAGAAVGTASGLGAFGMMGSLFLPGGPIGGAIVGGALGLLHGSENFKNFLYGKETTDEQGVTKRIGGLIPSGFQDWFKEHKIPLVGGGLVGGISTLLGGGVGFGLVPAVAVGAFGPVTMGAAWGLAMKSQAMQEALFGKDDGTDADGKAKKVGGLLNKEVFARMKKAVPRSLAGALTSVAGFTVMGEMGVLGSAVALGPIPAALAGAGIGILSASEGFTKTFFGYTDDHGEYHSGVLDKAKNFLMFNVFKPMQLYMEKTAFGTSKWFKQNIAFPIADALVPIKVALKRAGADIFSGIERLFLDIKDNFKVIFHNITDKTLEIFNTLLKPVKFLGNALFKSILFATGKGLQAPVKAIGVLGALSGMYVKGKAISDAQSSAKSRMSAAFTQGSLGDIFSAVSQYSGTLFDKESVYANDEYASEILAHEKAARQRNEDFDRENKVKSSRFDQRLKELNAARANLKDNNWGLTPEQIREKQRSIENAKQRMRVLSAAESSKDPNIAIGQEQISIQDEIAKNTRGIWDVLAGGQASGDVFSDNDHLNDDDGATTTAKANKKKKAEAAVIENSNKQTELLEDIKTVWLGPSKDRKNGFASKALDKLGGIFNFGGNVFGLAGGLFSMASSMARLVGIAGGIATAIGLMTDSKRDGDVGSKIADSSSASYVAERALRGTMNVGGTLAKAAGRSLQNTGIGQKILAKGYNLLGEVAPMLAKNVETGVTSGASVSDLVSKAMKHIGDVIDKNPFLKPFATVARALKSGFESLVSFLYKDDTIRKKIFQTVGKVGGKLATRYGAALASGGILTAGFAIYDGITGFADASRMFDVAPEDVDFRMRAISSLVNTIFGLPIPVITGLDVGLSLASTGVIAIGGTAFGQLLAKFGLSINGFDHRKVICQLIYNMTAEDDQIMKLAESQGKLQNEYQDYLKNNGMTEADMTFERYQSDVKGNQTVWDKYGSPILRRILGIEQKPGEKSKSFMDMITDPMHKLANWFSSTVDSIINFSPMKFIKSLFGFDEDETLLDAARNADAKISGWWETAKTRWFGPSNVGSGPSYNSTTKLGKDMIQLAGSFTENLSGFTGSGLDPTSSKYSENGTGGFPYYWSQNDPRISGKPVLVGDSSFGTFKDFGCAPTSFAMVASMLNGHSIDPLMAAKKITPDDVSYGDGFFANTVKGIKSSYFEKAASAYGLGMTPLDSTESMQKALSSGGAVILGGRNYSNDPSNPFTRQGHYVVVSGSPDKDKSKVFVYDPLGRRSGVYDANSVFENTTGFFSGGFAAAFHHGVNRDYAMSGNKETTINGFKLLDLSQYGVSFIRETDNVDLENLTVNAKQALDYISKYFKSLTGRDLVVSSGYRTHQTTGSHTTGNCFDVVDDRTHQTLEKDENGIRTKVIKEANRVGIKVLDEYVVDTEYKTGGHLHMDATHWLNKKQNTLNKKGGSILEFISVWGKELANLGLSYFGGTRYNPDSSLLGNTQGSEDILPTSREGQSISPKEVYKYLKSKGYSDAAAAGIMGNIQQESNFNSSDVGTYMHEGMAHGGLGLFQWYDASRRQGLETFAARHGKSYTDPRIQLEYMLEEAAAEGVLPKDFAHITSAEQAASHFNARFEKGSEDLKRQKYAKDFYNRIMSGEFSGSGMANATKRYADAHKRVEVKSSQSPNVTSYGLMSPSIINTDATMTDVVRTIRSIDAHAEYQEMIRYLRIIASSINGRGAGNVDPVTITQKLDRNQHQKAKHSLHPERYDDLLRSGDYVADMANQDEYQLAYSIAKGGNFRKR